MWHCIKTESGTVRFISLVGHGRSGGDRVHIDTFNTYARDVIEHIKDVKSEHPGVPCFLMGHSMVSLENMAHCMCNIHTYWDRKCCILAGWPDSSYDCFRESGSSQRFYIQLSSFGNNCGST